VTDRYGARKIGDHELKPESLMMSYGYRPALSEGAIKSPIFQTSTFVFGSAEEGKAFFEVAYGLREQGADEDLGLIYSRLNNPDLEILEDRLTLWDDAEAAAVFESGMAAISTTVFTFLRPGSILVFSEPVYGGTQHLFRSILPQFGIEVRSFRAVDGTEGMRQVVGEAAAEGRLAMIYLETPANPTNHLVDIEAAVALARDAAPQTGNMVADGRVLVAVDNTFLGPLFQHPLKHGADLVIYSLTKYVGGHSDVIAGACLGSQALIGPVKASRTFFGSMAGPWTGWLLMRSLETLKLRMEAQNRNARVLADWLRTHPAVEQVYDPGHLGETGERADIFRRQCLAPGGMLSFDVRGGEAGAFRFLNALKLVKLAVSLGGTESLAQHPATMTHSDIPVPEQRAMGITAGMVRLSVGVEDPEDLKADLDQAFQAAMSVAGSAPAG
jgi:methionine-gamma-lyase